MLDIVKIQRQPYHLVNNSPWPFVSSLSAFVLTTGGVLYMHGYLNGGYVLLLGFSLVLYCMVMWWRDVIREATFEGHHTKAVQLNLKYGMILFIVSEIMFFLAFFWAFFHSSLAPAIEIGAVWPPKSIEILNPWHIPFLNTLILLLSGLSITWCHHALISGFKKETIFSLYLTIYLAIFFTSLQAFEYLNSSFTIADSVYGSTFYMATGFHGAHVLIGSIFLIVNLVRIIKHHFFRDHHFGFEAAAWYWHFVDVVWLFLFISIYYWGC